MAAVPSSAMPSVLAGAPTSEIHPDSLLLFAVLLATSLRRLPV
jgi:hypothetical protein